MFASQHSCRQYCQRRLFHNLLSSCSSGTSVKAIRRASCGVANTCPAGSEISRAWNMAAREELVPAGRSRQRTNVQMFHESVRGITLRAISIVILLTFIGTPMQKLFAYPGGKWPIRKTIIGCFPKHTTYVDVFGGAASILIAKEKSSGEAFNDKNSEIVNFFRVVKHRPAELAERARYWVHSRRAFQDMLSLDPPFDEVKRAFRTWVLLADSFGARGLHFGTTRIGIHSVSHARENLDAVAQRFKDVHVECLDFDRCIAVYDAPETFFYCDPPYRNTRGGNSNYDLLTDEEWQTLKSTLSKIEGKFLLSSNADSFVVDLFKRFHIREIDVRVSLPRKKTGQVRKEILVSNYKLPSV